ncbi:trans-aconitate methyltransferase [Terrimonas sp.]|uniref:methyltransferase n=1 Tax=Terrimonas sp. TaxID=1914338 RepID=UPI000D51281E|nr:methyltransferase domain-containing protein [Terrimonas sp.]PVD49478.1 trans-aconitate methyltransferase [Terrimonas sp.]
MAWDPEKYNQFKNIRYQPFFDLMELISGNDLKNGIDIGCGTGEQTSILSKKFDEAKFSGIDPSPEMLAKSKVFESNNLDFKQYSVEDFLASDDRRNWDLIFSNAALQWSDNHETLFPGLIAHLSEHGQLAVQMPVQKENLLNKILIELAQEKPFTDFLHGWKRESPLLSIDAYAQIMFDNGLHKIQIIQKVYPIIADNTEKLFDFISGSSLIPYLEKMSPHEQELFVAAYKNRIQKAFKKFPAVYAFKRLLLYGCKTK